MDRMDEDGVDRYALFALRMYEYMTRRGMPDESARHIVATWISALLVAERAGDEDRPRMPWET